MILLAYIRAVISILAWGTVLWLYLPAARRNPAGAPSEAVTLKRAIVVLCIGTVGLPCCGLIWPERYAAMSVGQLALRQVLSLAMLASPAILIHNYFVRRS